MDREQKYKDKYGPTPYVDKKKGETFPDVVALVAQKMADVGVDVCRCDRNQCYAWADHVLFNTAAPAIPADAAADAPAVTAASVPVPVASEMESDDSASLPLGINVNIAIYTLVLSACELTRLDRRAGAEDRRKSLEKVADTYRAVCPQERPATTAQS
jgi:hypothetical protein